MPIYETPRGTEINGILVSPEVALAKIAIDEQDLAVISVPFGGDFDPGREPTGIAFRSIWKTRRARRLADRPPPESLKDKENYESSGPPRSETPPC